MDTTQSTRDGSAVVGRVVTSTEVTLERLSDLVVAAVEGGLPWGTIVSGSYQDLDFRFHLAPDESLLDGESDDWSVAADHLAGQHTQLVTPEVLLVGLRVAADDLTLSCYWQDFLDENEDADTGDVILQLALFGEVVFS